MRNDDGTRLGDKHLLQSMLRNESGAVADPLRPVLRDFFIATATGAFEDVRLYVSAGVQTDILEPGRTSSLARTGLMLAAANGHVDVCDYIVREGKANVDQADNTGRTALHHAAKAMQHETVQILLDHGANMHLRDNYGNTAFHSAARSGSQECVEVLASQEEENLRQVLSGKVFISKSGLELMGRPKQNVVGDVEVLFNQMIAEKMKRSEAQRFMKDWTFEATERIYAMVKTEEVSGSLSRLLELTPLSPLFPRVYVCLTLSSVEDDRAAHQGHRVLRARPVRPGPRQRLLGRQEGRRALGEDGPGAETPY